MPIEEYIDENGEVWSREKLIQEIERLLNEVDSKHLSVFAPEVIEVLDIQALGSIYQNLVAKRGNEIGNNQEWLFSLVDS